MLLLSGNADELQVSIRAPCEGSDISSIDRTGRHRKFQSALPVRGAMCTSAKFCVAACGFNPRSL